MKVDGIELIWVVVKDIKSAIEFYTKTVGLTLLEESAEYGWAELAGPKGIRLGLAQENPYMNNKAGSNAIVSVTVDDIEAAKQFYLHKGAHLEGEIIEVPGHVKMQTFKDRDGNMMQIVQKLDI